MSLMQRSVVQYLTEDEMHEPALQVLSALSDIHACGYLHNDVQPCNILLMTDRDGQLMAALNGFSKASPIG